MATENEDLVSAWTLFMGPSSTDRLQARGGDLEWAQTDTNAAPTVDNGYLLTDGSTIEFTTPANEWIWIRNAVGANDSKIVKG